MSATKYLVALPITPVVVGPFTGKSSLHCTLIHWFELTHFFDESKLRQWFVTFALDLIATKIELVSSHEALFGPKGDVPVFVLEQNPALLVKHRVLKNYLESHGCGMPRSDWIGDGYVPHVSIVEGAAFTAGSRHLVTSVMLLRQSANGEKSVILQLSSAP